jgi:DNA-binding MarR family transcriptional regulator
MRLFPFSVLQPCCLQSRIDNNRFNNYIFFMSEKLRDEIKQTRPFAGAEQEAFLNLQRTADVLLRGLELVLKPAALTQSQYNVLRILRGAGPVGLLCREVSDRMITRDPDMTRLLDRLESRNLVTKSRDRRDRRSITVRITEAGKELLARLDEPVSELHKRQLSHLGRERLHALIELLEGAREQLG